MVSRATRRLVLLLTVASAACSSGPAAPDAGYVNEVTTLRAQKDAQFNGGSDSPVPPAKRKEVLPHKY
jgi:hypothetical protein